MKLFIKNFYVFLIEAMIKGGLIGFIFNTGIILYDNFYKSMLTDGEFTKVVEIELLYPTMVTLRSLDQIACLLTCLVGIALKKQFKDDGTI